MGLMTILLRLPIAFYDRKSLNYNTYMVEFVCAVVQDLSNLPVVFSQIGEDC